MPQAQYLTEPLQLLSQVVINYGSQIIIAAKVAVILLELFQRIYIQLDWRSQKIVCLIFNSKLVHRGGWGPHHLCFMLAYQPKAARNEQARQKQEIYNKDL